MAVEILVNSVAVQSLQARYQSLTSKDQLIVKVLAAVTLFAVVVFGVISPATTYKNTAQTNYKSKLDTYQFMLQNKEIFTSVNKRQSSREAGQSLLGLANSSSKAFGLILKRFEPVGENGLGLWLEDVSFNSVILWLERLDKKYSIHVTEIVVDRQSSNGNVSVRLELQG